MNKTMKLRLATCPVCGGFHDESEWNGTNEELMDDGCLVYQFNYSCGGNLVLGQEVNEDNGSYVALKLADKST